MKIRPVLKINYEYADPDDKDDSLEEVYDFLFEKALAMAKTKGLAKESKLRYLNNNPQKEAIL